MECRRGWSVGWTKKLPSQRFFFYLCLQQLEDFAMDNFILERVANDCVRSEVTKVQLVK